MMGHNSQRILFPGNKVKIFSIFYILIHMQYQLFCKPILKSISLVYGSVHGMVF